MSRPKQGAEEEFESLLAADLDELGEDEREARLARFHAISEAPFETLGAPRVGHDAEADAWLREQLRERGSEEQLPQALEEMKGYYVLALLPVSPGLPVYTSFGYEGVDRYTFRGKFLDDVQDIIGAELYEQAWSRMNAAELLAYGEALLQAGRNFAKQHGIEALEHRYELPETDDDDAPESRAHIIFSAGNWCVWWARRGHGLEPYF
jgi:hypothetical protein